MNTIKITGFSLLLLLLINSKVAAQNASEYNNLLSINGFGNTVFGKFGPPFPAGSGYNTVMGRLAMTSGAVASNNVALGHSALFNATTGGANTAAGFESCLSIVTGNINAAAGYRSLFGTTYESNVGLGHNAGFSNTSGDNNTAIGKDSDFTNATDVFQTAVGYQALTNQSFMIRMGNTAITDYECQVGLTVTSDKRLKYNISENDVKGLEFILQLRPVTYNFDSKKQTEFLTRDFSKEKQEKYLNHDFSNEFEVVRSGFIAQEVEKSCIVTNYEFDGLHKPSSDKDYYGLSYESFVVPLTKAIKEQQLQLDIIKDEILSSKVNSTLISLDNYRVNDETGLMSVTRRESDLFVKTFGLHFEASTNIGMYGIDGSVIEVKEIKTPTEMENVTFSLTPKSCVIAIVQNGRIIMSQKVN